jgi:curved DNA-binding protein CbpA
VTDYFALLDEPRRPWLDTIALKQHYLALSSTIHPDKVHTAGENEKDAAARKFAELNVAYNCLGDPKSRILHLLELEAGAKPRDIQQIPKDLADLFVEVAALCNDVDKYLKEKPQNASPLLAVQSFEQSRGWVERLELLNNKLGVLRGQLEDGLKSLDSDWMKSDTAARKNCLPGLERLYRLFGYFNRWNNQIQERIVQLAL